MKITSYKDICVIYLTEGVKGVINARNIGNKNRRFEWRGQLRKAIKQLKDQDIEVSDLEEYVQELMHVRQKRSPKVGDTKTYIAQQICINGPFIRIPVEILGLEKGDLAKVEFLEGKIIIAKEK